MSIYSKIAVTAFIFYLGGSVFAAPANLPETGQTACYNVGGTVIDCTGTGQDAALKFGESWPDPRFVEGPTGCITDRLTGLMWIKDPHDDPNNPTAYTWSGAISFAESSAACGYSDWRLPNVVELESLLNLNYFDNQYYWLLSQGFPNVHTERAYWTSTTAAADPTRAWYVLFQDASLGLSYYTKTGTTFLYLAWPVRGGK